LISLNCKVRTSLVTTIARLIIIGCTLVLIGCTNSKPKPVPVSGSLTVGKKEADGALIRLWPENESKDGIRPLGYVQADGTFKLTSFQEGDGAIPGKYKVTVEWRPKKKSTMEPDGPDRLKGRYADPKSTKLEVMIHATETKLDPIQLD
jgi:hypothetical protein